MIIVNKWHFVAKTRYMSSDKFPGREKGPTRKIRIRK